MSKYQLPIYFEKLKRLLLFFTLKIKLFKLMVILNYFMV